MKPMRIMGSLLSLAMASTLFSAAACAQTVPADQSVLGPLLTIFADGGDDGQYDALKGVTWTGYETPDQDVRDGASSNYIRNGRLRLAGFGIVDMPKGVGADATVVKGNEGDSFLSLAGFTNGGVYRVSIQKFHASTDYRGILQRQLGSGSRVTPIATNCRGDADGSGPSESHAAFFKITLPGADDPVFVQAARDEEGDKYSPGSTFFDFFREEPTDTIAKLQCTR